MIPLNFDYQLAVDVFDIKVLSGGMSPHQRAFISPWDRAPIIPNARSRVDRIRCLLDTVQTLAPLTSAGSLI